LKLKVKKCWPDARISLSVFNQKENDYENI